MASHPTVGRPRSFTSPEDLQTKINCYFADCHENDEPPFMLEMAHYLGICRDTMADYAKGVYDEFDDDGRATVSFSYSIKRAKEAVEVSKIKKLVKGRWNTVGLIFDLKNNHNYCDKVESHTTTESHTTIVNKTMTDEQAQEAYSKQMG